MYPRKRALTALRREEPDRVPYCEIAIDPAVADQIMGQRAAQDFDADMNLEQNPRGVAEEKALSERLGRDNIAAILRAPVFVHKVQGKDGRPFYREGLIAEESDLEKIRLPDPYSDALYQEVEDFAKNKGDYALFVATRIGVFPTVLSIGYERFCYLLFDNPGLIEKVLDRYFEWEEVVVERLCQMDIDALWTTDDMAYKTGPMFSPEVFQRLFFPRMRKIAEKITVPWVIHSDGNLMPILEDLLDLGIAGLHPIESGAMDLAYMKRAYGHRVCLLGNINLNTLGLGTPEEVEAEVKARIQEAGPGGGYIVTSGNSVASYCRPENVLAMAQAVQKYGRYPLEV